MAEECGIMKSIMGCALNGLAASAQHLHHYSHYSSLHLGPLITFCTLPPSSVRLELSTHPLHILYISVGSTQGLVSKLHTFISRSSNTLAVEAIWHRELGDIQNE